MNKPLKTGGDVFVNGEWLRASGAPQPVVNPATEEVIAEAPVCGAAEVDAAVAAAREAFDHGPWPRLAAPERAARLHEFYLQLNARRPEFEQLLVEEGGSTVQNLPAQFDFAMALAVDALDEGAREPHQAAPIGTVPNRSGGRTFVGGIVRREPAGVVAGITPYNFPFFANGLKTFPALVTGNTVVLKPSSYTPLIALMMAEAADAVGLPSGVLNVITGGAAVGEQLTRDPRVDLVSFTGSDVTGSQIMAQAAPGLKRLHMELGGKSAMIVRADADLDTVVSAGLLSLNHAGQGCALTTRHLVHNSLRKAYVARLAEGLQAMKVGPPADPSVMLGPLIRETARERVERHVQDALDAGARLVTGGRRPPGLPRGYYFEATLFDDVDNASRLAQEEVFGPVLAVIGFDTDEEAVRIANESVYGLSGAIWSRDLAAAFDMACALRTGGVSINGGGTPAGTPISPFGGYKRSGLGREWGVEGLNAFTELKSISFAQI